MKSEILKQRTDAELVARFVDIALAQEYEQNYGSIKKYSRLFHQMQAVIGELKSRDSDQRRLLIDLHQHENWHVKYKAAKATLAVAPSESRMVLEQIAGSRHFPEAGSAGMTLWTLEEGIFKPT